MAGRILSGNNRKRRAEETIYLQQQSITKLQRDLDLEKDQVKALKSEIRTKKADMDRLRLIEARCNAKISDLKYKLQENEARLDRQTAIAQVAPPMDSNAASTSTLLDEHENTKLELRRVKMELSRVTAENDGMRQKLAWNPIDNFQQNGGYPGSEKMNKAATGVLFDDREPTTGDLLFPTPEDQHLQQPNERDKEALEEIYF
jgi:hypothetical protein